MSKLTSFSPDDIRKFLDDVPGHVRLDIVQMALDLAGIFDQSGIADAASGFISLLRGDLIGAAISAASILPLGDALKVARFSKYGRSMQTLISIAFRQPKLAFALRVPLRQMRDLINSITGFVGAGSGRVAEMIAHLDGISTQITRYFDVMIDIEKKGVKKVAFKKGRLPPRGQYVDNAIRGSEVTIREVVDVLDNALTSGNRQIREGANEMMARMAMTDNWVASAGIHRSGDATRHITVKLDTFGEAFHLRLSKEGHLFDITYGKEAVSTIR